MSAFGSPDSPVHRTSIEDGGLHARLKPPRAAYVHVPFCRHRCGYCNFSVVADRSDLIGDYLRAIDLETARLAGPHSMDTIYLGGGTPTQLIPADLTQLVNLLTSRFPLSEGGELTIEANPEDLTPEYGEVLDQLGVTRISLGVQSFSGSKLARLDRQHGEAEVLRGIEIAKSTRADLGIDLIFAAPAEELDEWQSDLASLITQSPAHVSCYGLTYEEGTSFFSRLQKQKLAEVDEERQRTQYELAIEMLTGAGFQHYEVSNFAKPGKRSRHNQTYWLGQTFLGIGPGAARFVNGARALNHRSLASYLQTVLSGGDPTVETEAVDEETYARERLVFGLRMLDGIDDTLFFKQTGFNLRTLAGTSLDELVRRGLLDWTNGRLHLTRSGLLVSDAIWPFFI